MNHEGIAEDGDTHNMTTAHVMTVSRMKNERVLLDGMDTCILINSCLSLSASNMSASIFNFSSASLAFSAFSLSVSSLRASILTYVRVYLSASPGANSHILPHIF